jgi:MFS family permease
MLGVAESGVFPATLVLLANWFPRAERARANAYWTLCQPLAIVASAPFTSWLLGAYGWQRMLVLEGLLPFLWLPLWWFCIRDHPKEAAWISPEEQRFLESTLQKERDALEPPPNNAWWEQFCQPLVPVMVAMYFLQNCAAYGCMTFFTASLEGQGFSAQTYGLLFALPYALTAVLMLANSWHSDRTGERRGHVALAYVLSGVSLILGVSLRQHFWLSYALLCLAIPGPFAAMGPFWAVPGEALPRAALGMAVGLINAFGNLGGFAGPYIAGWLKQTYGNVAIAFAALGLGMLIAAALAALLPANASSRAHRSALA